MSPEAIVSTAQLKGIISRLTGEIERGVAVKIASVEGRKLSAEILTIDNDPLIILSRPHSRKKTLLCGDRSAELLEKEGLVEFPKTPKTPKTPKALDIV